MAVRERIVMLVVGSLAIQLVTGHPLLTFSALYASEEEGLVTNAEYAERSHSSEARLSAEAFESSKELNSSVCTRTDGPHIPPKTSEHTYRIFVKVLMRDSRVVFKNKLREMKARKDENETSIGYFFIVLKKINKIRLVNESHEGKLMHDAIKEIATKTVEDETDAAWFEQMFDRIFCLALKANSDEDIERLADSLTIEEEISQHFHIFKQFWLNYAKRQNTKDTAGEPNAESDHDVDDTLCAIDVPNLPLNTTNIAYSIFAELVIRDTKAVAQRKLDELKSLEAEQYKWYIADLTKILENINNHTLDNSTEEGESMYNSLKSINEMSGEGDTAWLDHQVDLILCQAQKVRSESDRRSVIKKCSIEEAIEEHFEVFKQFWLNCKTLYIHRGISIYQHCKRQRKYYDD